MSLHQILLQPTDVLFFRDGRPMSGSLAGHTAAWPLPDITNHALHAALHRAELEDVHGHDHINNNKERTFKDGRKFGSLLTAGPFPVHTMVKSSGSEPLNQGNAAHPSNQAHSKVSNEKSDSHWFFPRPRDAQLSRSVKVTLRPVGALNNHDSKSLWGHSSLPKILKYAVANTEPPTKESECGPWISAEAYAAYLKNNTTSNVSGRGIHFLADETFADSEHQIGIGIDPHTQTQDKTNFYSAHYLRLRDDWGLGLFEEAMDKVNGDPNQKRDLIKALINGQPEQIVVGGQQRICTASRMEVTSPLPLPKGLAAARDFKPIHERKYAVKWILLSPAVWPELPEGISKRGTPTQFHPGGWLPNWICPRSGDVLLETVNDEERRRRRHLNYEGKGYSSNPLRTARLVAAIIPRAIPVVGWALPNDTDRPEGGAKSTHLAVPAGAVYYFEADTEEAAVQLADNLNWHGATSGTVIKNRRSTLMGEKGFGLGVCGTWEFYGQD